jgi:hypothetical protein
MELYANVIEMGRGIYGVEAASQHYFGVSARGLTREQSAMLAAILPNPKGWDPTKPGRTAGRFIECSKCSGIAASLIIWTTGTRKPTTIDSTGITRYGNPSASTFEELRLGHDYF